MKIPTQKPNITITVLSKFRSIRSIGQENDKYPFKLDGVVREWAHFPEDDACREIHFEMTEIDIMD